MRSSLLVALLVTLAGPAAQAHEFWIDPEDYTVEPGGRIVADLRVGQEFKGGSQAYVPRNFRRFEIADATGLAGVEMRMGDRPALDVTVEGEGLAIVLHVTRDYELTYTDPEAFPNFVTHKDAAWTLERHADRGLPETGFKERYSRHAKSLVAVGQGQGQDRAFGLTTEIVALANPYTDDLSGGLPVQLFHEGRPRPEAQVEVFARQGETVEVFTLRTDAEGVARVPVTPGAEYMLDAVVLRELDGTGEDGAVWESLWANLTFAVPRARR